MSSNDETQTSNVYNIATEADLRNSRSRDLLLRNPGITIETIVSAFEKSVFSKHPEPSINVSLGGALMSYELAEVQEGEEISFAGSTVGSYHRAPISENPMDETPREHHNRIGSIREQKANLLNLAYAATRVILRKQ